MKIRFEFDAFLIEAKLIERRFHKFLCITNIYDMKCQNHICIYQNDDILNDINVIINHDSYKTITHHETMINNKNNIFEKIKNNMKNIINVAINIFTKSKNIVCLILKARNRFKIVNDNRLSLKRFVSYKDCRLRSKNIS